MSSIEDLDFDALPPEVQQSILNGGAGIAPNGTETHLGNPPKNNAATLTVLGISLAIITFVVAVRFYAKVFCVRRVRTEDALGLLAFGAVIAHGWSVVALSQHPGLYVHSWDVKLNRLEPVVLTMNLLRTFYACIQLFAKNAILLEWINIFVPRPRRTRFWWLCWTMLTCNTLLYTAFIVLCQVRCLPVEKQWYPWVKGYCIDLMAADTTIMVFNLVCDLVILALPQSTIWKLKLRWRQKLGLSFLFSLGLLTCGCAAGRVHATVTLDYLGDWLHDVPIIITWGIGETTIIMMVFCIPAFPLVFKNHGRAGGSSSASSRGLHSDHNSKKMMSERSAGTSYRRMEEPDEVALVDMPAAKGRSDGLQHSRILKTTEVTTTEASRVRGGDGDEVRTGQGVNHNHWGI